MIIMLNGICVMKACEWTWFLDRFFCADSAAPESTASNQRK